jgi:hypothetical protein
MDRLRLACGAALCVAAGCAVLHYLVDRRRDDDEVDEKHEPPSAAHQLDGAARLLAQLDNCLQEPNKAIRDP